MGAGVLLEGWYLMSVEDLETELARFRGEDRPPSNAQPLSIEEALDYRNNGNLPDESGRSLRLVLRVDDASDLANLDRKRLAFEPDYLEAPSWRREGSKPVNVVPLRPPDLPGPSATPWVDDPEMSALEEEWSRSGAVDGVVIPAEFRSFIYKTIALLRSANREVTVDSISDSIARWLHPAQAERVRDALAEANSPQPLSD